MSLPWPWNVLVFFFADLWSETILEKIWPPCPSPKLGGHPFFDPPSWGVGLSTGKIESCQIWSYSIPLERKFQAESTILSHNELNIANFYLCHRENRQFFKKYPYFCPFLGHFGYYFKIQSDRMPSMAPKHLIQSYSWLIYHKKAYFGALYWNISRIRAILALKSPKLPPKKKEISFFLISSTFIWL